MNEPTVFRTSFQDLQVGDQFVTISSGWARSRPDYHFHTITRLSPKYLYVGCGEKLENGKFRYENVYSRADGRRIGGHSHDLSANLLSPELLKRIQEVRADNKTEHELRIIKERLNNTPIEEARLIVEFFRSNLPKYLEKA